MIIRNERNWNRRRICCLGSMIQGKEKKDKNYPISLFSEAELKYN